MGKCSSVWWASFSMAETLFHSICRRPYPSSWQNVTSLFRSWTFLKHAEQMVGFSEPQRCTKRWYPSQSTYMFKVSEYVFVNHICFCNISASWCGYVRCQPGRSISSSCSLERKSMFQTVWTTARVSQWRRRRKLFRCKAISCKVYRNTETVILRFFYNTGGILETQELFFNAYFTHKTIHAYLPLVMGSCHMQEYWDSDLFWFGDSWIREGFPPLCFLAPQNQNCHFSYCT